MQSRKRKIGILTAALAVTLCGAALALTACDTSEHRYSTAWTSDAEHHWHACLDDGCTSVSGEGAHTYGEPRVLRAATCTEPGEQVRECTVCGYEVRETISSLGGHTYATEWTYDAESHWHAATCADTSERADEAAHTYGEPVIVPQTDPCVNGSDEITTCTECGYRSVRHIAPTGHNYAETYTSDGDYHWRACANEGCTAKTDYTAHSLGSIHSIDEYSHAVSCSVCGYEEVSAHTEWAANSDGVTVSACGVCSMDTGASMGLGFTWNNGAYTVSSVGSAFTDGATHVVIPETYDDGTHGEAPVTQITASFRNSAVTEVTLPSSINYIGDRRSGARFNYVSVERVNISSLAAYLSIDYNMGYDNPIAYSNASLYLNGERLTEIVVPREITEIKYSALYGLTDMTAVYIHSGVTAIGIGAFTNCTGLTNIYYEGSQEEWGQIDINFTANTYYNNAVLNTAPKTYNYTMPVSAAATPALLPDRRSV